MWGANQIGETTVAADAAPFWVAPGVAAVRWDPEARVVLVEWEGWANTQEFMALLDAEIRALRANRASRLLADCRRQRVLNPEDQNRADREWIPQALEAGLKRFAVVLPHSVLAAMNLRDQLGKVPNDKLEIAYFDTPDEAKAWLTR
jgi:hypothetical protein